MASMCWKISGVTGDSSCSIDVAEDFVEKPVVEAFDDMVECLGREEPDKVRLVPWWTISPDIMGVNAEPAAKLVKD